MSNIFITCFFIVILFALIKNKKVSLAGTVSANMVLLVSGLINLKNTQSCLLLLIYVVSLSLSYIIIKKNDVFFRLRYGNMRFVNKQASNRKQNFR